MANLSIMGLYNYNNSIFDGFNVPQGIDKQVCINEICLQCAELEVIFPSFNTMKIAIKNWSDIEGPIWQKLFETENLNYNPLWNVDADITETHATQRTRTGSDSRTRAENGAVSEDITRTGQNSEQGSETKAGTLSGSGTSEQTKSNPGYNSNTLVTTEKTEGSTTQSTTTADNTVNQNSGQHSETENRTNTNNGSVNESGNNNESETVTNTDTIRRTGNIGVTSSQELLQRQRDVVQFSTIKYIVESFKKRFCLMVY